MSRRQYGSRSAREVSKYEPLWDHRDAGEAGNSIPERIEFCQTIQWDEIRGTSGIAEAVVATEFIDTILLATPYRRISTRGKRKRIAPGVCAICASAKCGHSMRNAWRICCPTGTGADVRRNVCPRNC